MKMLKPDLQRIHWMLSMVAQACSFGVHSQGKCKIREEELHLKKYCPKMHVNFHWLYSLLKRKSRYTSDSPSLKEEHSSYSDVPIKYKVMKNGYLHKYCLGKKGLRKESIISSRAYGQGVAGALYFRAVCARSPVIWRDRSILLHMCRLCLQFLFQIKK